MKTVRWMCLACLLLGSFVEATEEHDQSQKSPIYTYTLTQSETKTKYDEAMAVACFQGIINRKSPSVYVLSNQYPRPQYWLKRLSQEERWLTGRPQVALHDLTALRTLAGDQVRGVVIWDPLVPASVNVATTYAGVHAGVVLSPEFAAQYASQWKLPVLKDFRGQFTGQETGSPKNDAYRWAIREFIAKGACSTHLLCLYEDAYLTRQAGNVGYVVTRDWAIKHRSFVFDLSPWGDEHPLDDLKQNLGTDLDTYRRILSETQNQAAGKEMTEIAGFFSFPKYSNVAPHKSKHEPVPTEWESVWVMSPYNCYQNTVASDCYNQSFHSHAQRKPLKQNRVAKPKQLEKKAYICILMADYDSTTPLYEFLPNHWHNPDRGSFPLAWGINPNLLETYPDLIAYFYHTATEADVFTADASAAGYMNPNRIPKSQLPLFVRHNQKFYREADMSLSPMVLDWDQPSAEVKDAFLKFSPDGLSTIVMDLHENIGQPPEHHIWKGMPVMELINAPCNWEGPDKTADRIGNAIRKRNFKAPGFYFFRITWVNPTQIKAMLASLKVRHPSIDFEVLDPYTFYSLFKQSQAK